MPLFVTHGTTSVAIDRICDAAGISLRTFHRHFPVKEDVVRPVLQESISAAVKALDHASADGDVVEVRTRCLLVEVSDGNLAEVHRKFVTLLARSPEYRLRWLATDPDLVAAVRDYRERCMPHARNEDEPYRRLAPELVVTATRAVFDYWLLEAPDRSIDGLVRDGISLVLRGAAQGRIPCDPARTAVVPCAYAGSGS
jgi:AcrR family transcriptional regulator